MELAIGLLGFFVGLFLWSNIYGSLFGTLPLEKKLVKAHVLKKVNWAKIIAPILFAVIVLGVTAIFAKSFFIGTLPAGVVMLFNIGKLRREAAENLHNETTGKN